VLGQGQAVTVACSRWKADALRLGAVVTFSSKLVRVVLAVEFQFLLGMEAMEMVEQF
jgi:hypothetical protein